jgi:hypothetical protein
MTRKLIITIIGCIIFAALMKWYIVIADISQSDIVAELRQEIADLKAVKVYYGLEYYNTNLKEYKSRYNVVELKAMESYEEKVYPEVKVLSVRIFRE